MGNGRLNPNKLTRIDRKVENAWKLIVCVCVCVFEVLAKGRKGQLTDVVVWTTA